jgi:steroid delta-isomerase-like uncharacterized protein
MSTETNLALVRRYQAIYNSNNLAALSEVLAPDFVPHNMMPGVPASLDGCKALHQSTLTSYPDFHTAIDDLFGEDDKVVMRFALTGTHEGDFLGIPPTGKRIYVSGTSIFRIANGRIVEHWGEEDVLGWMQQLGAIPTPEPAGL